MKKNKVIALLLLLAVGVTVVLAASGKVSFATNPNTEVSKTTNTYVNSQVDTLVFNRERGLSGLAFATRWKDSVKVTSILLRRVVDGIATAFITTDSLMTGLPYTAVLVDTTIHKTVTLAPLADQYWVIVTYVSSGNGVTTPTAVYEFIKQYAR
jgi:hypothetical protein